MKRFLPLLALALAATSCRGMVEVHPSYRFVEHPGKGLVAVSTRISSQCGSGASVEFESDGGEPGAFLFQNTMMEPDFKDPEGYFWVMQLPAGRYKLRKLHIASKYSSRSQIDSAFTVKEGQTTYLGELRMDVVGCSRFDFRVYDRWDRDEQLFAKRMLNVPAESVTKQILPTPPRAPAAPAAVPASLKLQLPGAGPAPTPP